MGKGYNNYMSKKFFHPSSFDNIKRVWMAEQEDEFEKKKEAEKLQQYKREQEMLESRALLGDEKARLGIAFLYDRPPGAINEDDKEAKEVGDKGDKEKEIRFEWQRKFNAPRETYAKGNEEIRDQPFGIEVRNVRCVKCHNWGHVNTDRICPLYGRSITMEPDYAASDAKVDLAIDMRQRHGLAFTRSAEQSGFNDILLHAKHSVDLVESERSKARRDNAAAADPELEFLRNLSTKQRKKLLKKLEKMDGGGGKVTKKSDVGDARTKKRADTSATSARRVDRDLDDGSREVSGRGDRRGHGDRRVGYSRDARHGDNGSPDGQRRACDRRDDDYKTTDDDRHYGSEYKRSKDRSEHTRTKVCSDYQRFDDKPERKRSNDRSELMSSKDMREHKRSKDS